MFYVEIVKSSSGEVVKRMGPMSERKAEKVEIGVSINLNHEEFFTRIALVADGDPLRRTHRITQCEKESSNGRRH